MIQFEDSEHIVIIEDAFAEAIIKTAQWWKERIKQDIEKLIVEEVVYQMKDDSEYIRFNFDPTDDTARALTTYSSLLSIIVAKSNVTVRNKWKSVRIKGDSFYKGLNESPKFIEALTKEYNTNYDFYMYYLPVTYSSHLLSKDESMDDFMNIHVDIPFSDIEVY